MFGKLIAASSAVLSVDAINVKINKNGSDQNGGNGSMFSLNGAAPSFVEVERNACSQFQNPKKRALCQQIMNRDDVGAKASQAVSVVNKFDAGTVISACNAKSPTRLNQLLAAV